MSAAHTPEPWEIGIVEEGTDKNIDGLVIWNPVHSELPNGKYQMVCLLSPMQKLNEKDQANAQRIIECVNAMAGIESPQKLRTEYDESICILKTIKESMLKTGINYDNAELFNKISKILKQ